ncbi:diaminopimelate epimerase [Bacillus sp. AFS076308]|uniref:diaminopimelate epimerase n=1 Tax=unclassified Bacillus (in: firmicutes) TaxID=185979 RepID=UPI000BF3CC1C|nr:MULTISPECIES: diaminopimelate epimerase [unclassified Bacillus (in: firmicutes)]PFO04842.1 diaminopimelate epimerase [Bacillus sp. AFS076308]PGV47492.1 diaminopimelate epimerase [Bacillus sp. AFS037270]
MQIDLIKGHGSGNDFLLIDEISNDYLFTEEDRANLAKVLCNRGNELGADGILFIMKSDRADGRMRVFNADGSEASMCGNGLRLVARYICELKGLNKAVIETMKANLKVMKQEDIFPQVHTYQVEISPVMFELKALPLNLPKPTLFNEKIKELSDELRFTALAVPNPHLIAIVETEMFQNNLQKELSEKVNGPNDLFPDGVNVSFVKPLEKGSIYVRTFERGVGFTNACGTAMSASSLVTCLTELNKYEKVINVYNNGGKVQCVVHKLDDTYSIDLIGNATYLYRASIQLALNEKTFSVTSRTELSEQQTYEKLQSAAQEVIKQTL